MICPPGQSTNFGGELWKYPEFPRLYTLPFLQQSTRSLGSSSLEGFGFRQPDSCLRPRGVMKFWHLGLPGPKMWTVGHTRHFKHAQIGFLDMTLDGPQKNIIRWNDSPAASCIMPFIPQATVCLIQCFYLCLYNNIGQMTRNGDLKQV